MLQRSIDPDLIDTIKSLHREHRGLQRARGDMDRRIKAEERYTARVRAKYEGTWSPDEPKFPPVTEQDREMVKRGKPRYFIVRDRIEEQRVECHRKLCELASQLPVAPWITSIKGVAIGSLGAIVGECGDLLNYPTVAKVWKRLCVHVIDGKAATRISGDISQEFVPHRRAELRMIGSAFLRAGGPYADLYRERKQIEIEKAQAAGLTIKPAAQIKAGERNVIAEGVIHNRALRYSEKRLIKDLWRAWRRTLGLDPGAPHAADIPPTEQTMSPVPQVSAEPDQRTDKTLSPTQQASAEPPPEAVEPLSPQTLVPRRRGRPPRPSGVFG